MKVEIRFNIFWIFLFGAVLFVVALSSRVAVFAASPELERLVNAARKEGVLEFTIASSQGEKGARDLIAAFRQRFGLNIRFSYDLSGQESQKFSQAIAETKNGIPPTFDLIEGTAENVLLLKEAGGAEMIENWEPLLAQIAPEAYKARDKISPTVLRSYGFVRASRILVLLYNPKVISERDLPRSWKDMGHDRFAGAFSVPPWISHALMGLLRYDQNEWLEIVKSWGKNKRDVLTYSAGVERMLLGDLKFLYANDHYYYEKKERDPNAPIAVFFFEDFTPASEVMYVVRRHARSPNAAKLFALWASGSEASLIYEKYSHQANLILGTGPLSREMKKTLSSRNLNPVSWFDESKGFEKFLWLKTQEGQVYQKMIARAHRTGQ